MSASAVVVHYEEALYQVYAPLPLQLVNNGNRTVPLIDDSNNFQYAT